MAADRLNKFWLLATFLLIVIIVVSSVIIWTRRSNGQPIIFSSPQPCGFNGNINVEGAVSNPGIYPLKAGDTLDSVLQSSGGVVDTADLSRIRLYVPQVGEGNQPQKIDINRADAWLLEALPDIGTVKAQAIVQYRQQNGIFRSLEEITRVPGISETIYQKIKPLITLAD